MLALPYRWVTQIKFISANNLILGKTYNLDFSVWLQEDKISLEPTGSQGLWLKIIHVPKWHIRWGALS